MVWYSTERQIYTKRKIKKGGEKREGKERESESEKKREERERGGGGGGERMRD